MKRMLDALRDLRQITATPGRGCTRLAYTELEDQAHDYVWASLQDIAGLRRVEDAAGNMFVLPDKADDGETPCVLVGSHLDTVIEGGWLDGALGVTAGMHVLRECAVDATAHRGVGLVVFRDEEGVRFKTGLFGSKVFSGTCRLEDLDATDDDGVAVRNVVPDPGGCCDYAPPVEPAAFLECHIEQGARLIGSGHRVGVVTGIVGIRRFALIGTGVANHAGTTEMTRRVDALIPVADIVARLPSLVEELPDTVITCGRLEVEPGAPNVVPGRATAVIEIRAGTDEVLDVLERRLRDFVGATRGSLAAGSAVVELRPLVSVLPTPTDPGLGDHLVRVLEDRGIPFTSLPSMAGHDTQHAALRCPAGMFFVPSIDGISHNPLEHSSDEDIGLAGDVMLAWAKRCVEACS